METTAWSEVAEEQARPPRPRWLVPLLLAVGLVVVMVVVMVVLNDTSASAAGTCGGG